MRHIDWLSLSTLEKRKMIAEAVEWVNQNYGQALKGLAELDVLRKEGKADNEKRSA